MSLTARLDLGDVFNSEQVCMATLPRNDYRGDSSDEEVFRGI
jgi:hypothetical protein